MLKGNGTGGRPLGVASQLLWGQFIAIVLMAVALGLDALSMGLGIGMKGIRKRDILTISLIIAFFHIVMPLAGMLMGGYVGKLLGQVATVGGGILLILLGAHMVYHSLKGSENRSLNHRSVGGMTMYAFSVSIDSFSVGVSLGMFSGDPALTVLTFGAVAGLMAMTGLLLGSRVAGWIGEYGEALGGVILLAFGIRFLI